MNHHLYCLLYIFLSVFGVAPGLVGQELTGMIRTENGSGISNVKVEVKHKNQFDFSDGEGRFAVAAVKGDTLLIHYGYRPFEIMVGSSPTLEIHLQLRQSMEKIDFGYGESPAKDAPGSIIHLEKHNLNQGHIHQLFQLIQGRAPGLMIAKAGSDPLAEFEVQQRGLHTLLGHNEPLIVIDGLPGASLLTVDPQDVVSVDILRDAAVAAIYGARGANGVVLINTKKAEGGIPTISYSGYGAIEQVTAYPDVLSSADFSRLVQNPDFLFFNPRLNYGSANNWPKRITHTGFSQAHHFAISQHMNDAGGYRFALNYRHTEGIANGNSYDQWNALISVKQRLYKNRISLNAQMGHTQRPYQTVLGDAFWYAATFNPTAPIKDDTATNTGGYFQIRNFDVFNPVAMIEQSRIEGLEQVSTINTGIQWNIWEGLSWHNYLAIQQAGHSKEIFLEQDSYFLGYLTNGVAIQQNNTTANRLVDSYLVYEKIKGIHQIKLTAGYSYQLISTKGLQAKGYDFIANTPYQDPGFSWGANADFPSELENFRHDIRLSAFWGRLQYTLNQWLSGSVVARREGSSRFGPKRRWGHFYGANVGVDLGQVLNIKGVDQFKIRGGWGVSGNLPPDGIYAVALYGEGPAFFYNNRFVKSIVPITRANPALQWESRSEWTLGVDFAFFKGRLFGAFDYYQNTSADLTYREQPGLFVTRYSNFGAINNKGFEFSLQGDLMQNDHWNISSRVMLASNESTYGSFGSYLAEGQSVELYPNLGSLAGSKSVSAFHLQSGTPVGQMTGPEYRRVDNGNWVFEDGDGDGIFCGCEKDFKVVGQAQPKLVVGWGNTIKWNRWDIQFLVRGVLGHSLINTYLIAGGTPSSISNYNLNSSALEGDVARLAQSPVFSSYFVETASYWQLDNLTLGYQLMKRSKKSVRLYIGGNRLITTSKYSGMDPELRLDNRLQGGVFPGEINNLNPGIDNRGAYYPSRSIVFGIKADF